MIIDNVKVLLGLTDDSKDDVLNILLNQAEQYALSYTHATTTAGMDAVLERMIVFNYNRLGTEGLVSENYTGASYTYTDEYPTDIMAMLDSFSDDVNKRGRLITY